MSNSPFGVSGTSGAGFGMFAPAAPADPNQPEWMTSFQQTMKEIEDKGFSAYAKDLNDKKIAEMRQQILDKMGLTEDDLKKMSPQAQGAIEKMISEEIRQRLAADALLQGKDKEKNKDGTADATATDGVSTTSPADQAAQIAEMQAGPNGMGAGMTLIHAMEAPDANQAAQTEAQKQAQKQAEQDL